MLNWKHVSCLLFLVAGLCGCLRKSQWDATCIGTTEDEIAALLDLANQGNVTAQYTVAFMYDSGTAVEKSLAKALYWYRLAAYNGDARASETIYDILCESPGSTDATPLFWLMLSAKQGNAFAQKRLAVAYHKGITLPKNGILAYAWAVQAQRGLAPDELPEELLSQIRDKLTSGQVGDALSVQQWISNGVSNTLWRSEISQNGTKQVELNEWTQTYLARQGQAAKIDSAEKPLARPMPRPVTPPSLP